MSAVDSHALPHPQAKLDELLDAVRREFHQAAQDASQHRMQHQKDCDFKINQSLAVMQQIRNTVYELELSHRKLKDSYQEEINRLKLEIAQKDQQIAALANASPATASAAAAVVASAVTPATSAVTPAVAQAPVVETASANGPTLAPLISALGSQLQPGTQQNLPAVSAPTFPKQEAGTTTLPPVTAPATAASPATAQEPAPVAPAPVAAAAPIAPAAAAPAAETGNTSHYLVPYSERASQNKPIPPFLTDLDAAQVPEALKKHGDDYYVLYNPALPRSVDVELLCSLDHTSVVCCVKFSNDGEFLATGCNKTTQVYRVATGELVARLADDSAAAAAANKDGNADSSAPATSPDLYIRSVCFSPDGKFLATGAEDRLIRIWDIAQRKIVMVLQGHDQDVYSLDYFPSGDKLVSGSGDRTVRIWDLKSGQCALTLSIEDGVTTVAVSPGDGKYIAAGSLDRAVRVWDSETGFLVERLDSENELGTGHKDSVYSVVFTRNGNKVVSGSLDRTVKLWNLRGNNDAAANANGNGTSAADKATNGTCEVTYVGHKDFVLSVTTTANDNYILSGSKDRGVLFWDTPSGNPLLMLQGHKNSVISVAVANGKPLGEGYEVFATGSGDCRARIWKFAKTNGEPRITEA